MNPRLAQFSISFSKAKGTLRGMHYEVSPCEEAKLVRCTSGAIYDVIIDLRPKSPSFKRYLAEILSARNYRMLYVPEGFAHGFLTLEDNVKVMYKTSNYYAPALEGGIRWNDPIVAVPWPAKDADILISEKDKQLPLLESFSSPFNYDGNPLGPLLTREL